MLGPQSVCTVCGRKFTFNLAPFSSQPTLQRVRHCAYGKYVDVAGPVNSLLEINENRWVRPVYGDLLEDDESLEAERK
jgi:hypothetical protein